LKPAGATFTTIDSDFVSSDFVDFHPTDAVVDADGSLLVIDTGGWYKLCCPTAQLWKPDVLGGIYRVRKIGAKPPNDPRGKNIDWAKLTASQLWSLFDDRRPVVRQRASRGFVERQDSAELKTFIAAVLRDGNPDSIPHVDLRQENRGRAAMERVWALSQIETPESRQLIREYFFAQASESIQRVAMQSISLNRDAGGKGLLARTLHFNKRASNRRIAAEALGRLGDRFAGQNLLEAAEKADDRILQHSIIYALIELADPPATRKGLVSKEPKTIAAALIALDQMPGGDLKAADVIPHLGAADETLRQAARWVVLRHSDWGGELTEWLRAELTSVRSAPVTESDRTTSTSLETMFVAFSSQAPIQQLLADVVAEEDAAPQVQAFALRVMNEAKLHAVPQPWVAALARVIDEANPKLLPLALAAARSLPPAATKDAALQKALSDIAESSQFTAELRIDALAIMAGHAKQLSDAQFELLAAALTTDNPVSMRSAAADAIAKSHLSQPQLGSLCGAVRSAGPLEVNRLFKPFEQSPDEQIGLKLIASLKESPALSSVRINFLREALAKYGSQVQEAIGQLESLVNVDAAVQRKQIEELLPQMSKGDVRRGHSVFYSTKAACAACHRLGYAGGTIGPELTHIGKTRTERDLLESVLFPSLSFVRSYEPVQIVTQDGKTLNGVIRDENTQEYVVATGADQDQIVRIPRSDVEELQPSNVSIMPAGLDKQLTPQELADLVAFLKDTADRK
jgi:putative heme-binding domain-containing protein